MKRLREHLQSVACCSLLLCFSSFIKCLNLNIVVVICSHFDREIDVPPSSILPCIYYYLKMLSGMQPIYVKHRNKSNINNKQCTNLLYHFTILMFLMKLYLTFFSLRLCELNILIYFCTQFF